MLKMSQLSHIQQEQQRRQLSKRGINRVWVDKNRYLSLALVKWNPLGVEVGQGGQSVVYCRSSQIGWITAELPDAHVDSSDTTGEIKPQGMLVL